MYITWTTNVISYNSVQFQSKNLIISTFKPIRIFIFISSWKTKLLQKRIDSSCALKHWNQWYEMYHVYVLRCKTYNSKVRPRRSRNGRKGSFSNHPPQPPTRNGFHCRWWLLDDLYSTRWIYWDHTPYVVLYANVPDRPYFVIS